MNKKKVAIIAGTFIVGLIIGRASMPKCSIYSHSVAVEQNKKLTAQVTDLQKKVNRAKPYFDMTESERIALHEEVKKQKSEEEAKKFKENTKVLSSGNYLVGKDFEGGTYDIEIVSGNGNVYSNGGENAINVIMGTDDNPMYQKTFKNAKFYLGTTLKVDGATIKITPTELLSLQ